MEKNKTAWDVKREGPDRGHGYLPVEMLEDWARHQTYMSKSYHERGFDKVSATEEGSLRKQQMLERIYDALTNRSNFNTDIITYRMAQLDRYLEDPGLLENFEYFDIPSSDYMLQFYFAVFDRHIAEAMDFLHNYGRDLQGVARRIPEDDIWYQMSYFEGMNIDKRKQAKDLVTFIKHHHIIHATAFGGGNIPERLYGLPDDLYLTVFDNGPVSPLEDLFPDVEQHQRVNYIHELLSEAPKHQELIGTQDLVWMHGVSMYLSEKEMIGAILCAAALLRPSGYMRYDYLIQNDSMDRVISTQHWPNDPQHPMTISDFAEAAIRSGNYTLGCVNAQLGNKVFMDVTDINVNLIEPWGVTSVNFTVQKHA